MNEDKLEKAKTIFFILLGIDIFVTAVIGLNTFSTIGTLKDVQLGTREVDESLISNLKFWDGFAKVVFLTLIGVGLGLVNWLNACYRFAKESLGATGFKNERWTTAGWIIPIFNLFKPYQVVNEIYRASAPTYKESDGWKKESGSGLLLTWWIFWVVTHLIGTMIGKQLLRGAMRDDVTIQQAIGMSELQAWSCVISVIVAGLWFVIASTITQRLFERFAQLAVGGGTGQFASSISSMPTTQQVAAVSLASKHQPSTDTVFGSPTPAMQIDGSLEGSVGTEENASEISDNARYAMVAEEIETGHIDKGLWARLYADTDGDEHKTKARYIKHRVEELSNLHHQQKLARERSRLDTIEKARLASLSEEQRAYELLPKGQCPNCKAIIPLASDACPKCPAVFAKDDWSEGWRVLPI